MNGDASLPGGYFDALYARDPDPWGFRTRPYEAAKYDDTLAALEGRRFRRAVEVGCSIGELTARLEPACDALLGIDIAEAALDKARRRNADAPNIAFARMTVPAELPAGRFDLIVLSEVLYYFGSDDLERVAKWVGQALEPGGRTLLVHWLGETPDYPQTGDGAVEAFLTAAAAELTTDLRWRREAYRVDRLRRASDAVGPAGASPA